MCDRTVAAFENRRSTGLLQRQSCKWHQPLSSHSKNANGTRGRQDINNSGPYQVLNSNIFETGVIP